MHMWLTLPHACKSCCLVQNTACKGLQAQVLYSLASRRSASRAPGSAYPPTRTLGTLLAPSGSSLCPVNTQNIKAQCFSVRVSLSGCRVGLDPSIGAGQAARLLRQDVVHALIICYLEMK